MLGCKQLWNGNTLFYKACTKSMCCISHFISGHWKGLHRWGWWKVLSVHFYEVRFMDTAHTYISKEAKWLPGYDRTWWGLLNDFQYFPYCNNTFIVSQCDPEGKIEHEAITTAAATLASYPAPSLLLHTHLVLSHPSCILPYSTTPLPALGI